MTQNTRKVNIKKKSVSSKELSQSALWDDSWGDREKVAVDKQVY